MRKPDWKELQSHRDWACLQGENIADSAGFCDYPVDPFAIAADEPAIYLKGADLGDKLDGRLSFCRAKKKSQRNRFLLAYNTRYDRVCTYEGDHCPKVRFTVAHELGHYFLDRHRQYLQQGGQPYSCYTETYSGIMMELEADAFGAGLMMPSKVLTPIINRDVGDQPDLDDIRSVAGRFQVSLTSMMVRWTRLSDFPCAVFSVSDVGGKLGIRWGWVSEAFAQVGAYWRRYGEFRSKDAIRFLGSSPDLTRWQSGSGLGMMSAWVETDQSYCQMLCSRFMIRRLVVGLDRRSGRR